MREFRKVRAQVVFCLQAGTPLLWPKILAARKQFRCAISRKRRIDAYQEQD
jgi:hypothetical protein